ncbi:Aquaporin NIP6-1 [Linum perenne]
MDMITSARVPAGTRKSSSSWLPECFSVEEPVEGSWPPSISCSYQSSSCCQRAPPPSLIKKVGAEFIGTLILMFAGIGTAIVNHRNKGSETLMGLAASTGIAAAVVIQSTCHISGGHLNPALTIAFAASRRFPWKHVPFYIVTQFAASISASLLLGEVFRPIGGAGVTIPSGGDGQAFVLELFISFTLMFVIMAVIDTKSVSELGPAMVGATVMLNILIAGCCHRETTGASMNPARSLGPAIVTSNYKGLWIYFTAPVVGTLFGTAAYAAVRLPPQDHLNGHDEAPEKPCSVLPASR